jgi:hypothetical protein
LRIEVDLAGMGLLQLKQPGGDSCKMGWLWCFETAHEGSQSF